MSKFLIGCEADVPGSALGDALAIGRALRAAGHAVTYAVADPTCLAELAGADLSEAILPAPSMMQWTRAAGRPPTVAGLADLMAISGYESEARLCVLARSWAALIALVRPDAIIGLDAPVLWLAGPTRRPTLAAGDRFALPPLAGGRIPRPSAEIPPIASDTEMLANANAALTAIGGQSIGALTDIPGRCAVCVYGLPQLDPYLALREALPPTLLGPVATLFTAPARNGLAVFLDARCPEIDNLVVALSGLGSIRLDAFVSAIEPAMARFLAPLPGLRLHRDAVSWMAALEGTAAVAHHGHSGIAARGLAAGLPQLALPWRFEQRAVADILATLGCGATEGPDVPVERLVEALKSTTRDGERIVRARHHAEQVAASSCTDATATVVALAEKLAAGEPFTRKAAP